MIKMFGRILLVVFLSSVIIACEKEEDILENPIVNKEEYNYIPIETELMKLVNSHRNRLGLQELIPLNIVSKEANSHTSYMILQDKVSHDNFNERTLNLVNQVGALSVGENVGFGFKSAKSFLNGWLSNPGHKEILENENYTHFGISAKKNLDDRFFITHIFIER
jgi:uncharacterized protein YkwD